MIIVVRPWKWLKGDTFLDLQRLETREKSSESKMNRMRISEMRASNITEKQDSFRLTCARNSYRIAAAFSLAVTTIITHSEHPLMQKPIKLVHYSIVKTAGLNRKDPEQNSRYNAAWDKYVSAIERTTAAANGLGVDFDRAANTTKVYTQSTLSMIGGSSLSAANAQTNNKYDLMRVGGQTRRYPRN